jgi:hypothetical protein
LKAGKGNRNSKGDFARQSPAEAGRQSLQDRFPGLTTLGVQLIIPFSL